MLAWLNTSWLNSFGKFFLSGRRLDGTMSLIIWVIVGYVPNHRPSSNHTHQEHHISNVFIIKSNQWCHHSQNAYLSYGTTWDIRHYQINTTIFDIIKQQWYFAFVVIWFIMRYCYRQLIAAIFIDTWSTYVHEDHFPRLKKPKTPHMKMSETHRDSTLALHNSLNRHRCNTRVRVYDMMGCVWWHTEWWECWGYEDMNVGWGNIWWQTSFITVTTVVSVL